MTWQVIGHSLLTLGLALLAALLLHWSLYRFALRHSERPRLYLAFARALRRPALAGFLLIAALVVFPATRWPPLVAGIFEEILTLLGIAIVAWLLIALAQAGVAFLSEAQDSAGTNNLSARKMYTRAAVIHRIFIVIILVIATGTMLMTFPQVRTLGASLMASAGLIGLIAGLAAQPLLTNLIAGLQIALTQPIRIDDVVVITGEWGWIEEIEVAYVVVRIWDLRRMIVPLSYLLQQPIQNWTYKSSELLGYVHVYADYSVSVEAVRQELERILRSTPLWDGATWNLQVTGSDERAVQMRALFSARDSNERWNLMVLVRERLIEFLHLTYPGHLPRARVELAPPGVGDHTRIDR